MADYHKLYNTNKKKIDRIKELEKECAKLASNIGIERQEKEKFANLNRKLQKEFNEKIHIKSYGEFADLQHKQIKELESEIRVVRIQRDNWIAKNKQLKQRLEKITLNVVNDELKEENRKLFEENEDLKKHTKRLMDERNRAQRQSAERWVKYGQLGTDFHNLRNELEGKKENFAIKKVAIASGERTIKEQEEIIKELEQKIEVLTATDDDKIIEDQESEIRKLNNEIRQLKKDLEIFKAENTKQFNQHQITTFQRNSLEKEVKKANDERVRLQERVRIIENDNYKCDKHIESQEEEIKKLKSTLHESWKMREKLNETIVNLRKYDKLQCGAIDHNQLRADRDKDTIYHMANKIKELEKQTDSLQEKLSLTKES